MTIQIFAYLGNFHQILIIFGSKKFGYDSPFQTNSNFINLGEFECDLCDKLYTSNEELTKHRSSHKEHTCESCNLTFGQWTLYQQHRKEHKKVFLFYMY